MTPYAGWSWIIKIEDDVKAAYIIIGTNKIWKEDYLRTLLLEIFFKYNQFALGYRLDF
jgi:hypothetical protein